MYRYNPLHEKRKQALFDRLQKHFPQEDEEYFWELLDHFEEIDPTSRGKYVTWLVREYLDGKITLPEDSYHLNQVLVKFHRFKHLLENRDIFYYSKGKLAVEVGKFEIPDDTNSETRLRAKLEGRKILSGATTRNGRLFRVVRLTTSLAAREAAKGADWCISSLEVAQDYISSGLLLLIEEFSETEEKWKSLVLSHLGYRTARGRHEESPDYLVTTAQMMDIENEPIEREAEFDFDVISNLLHHEFMPFLQHKIRMFGSDWDRRYWDEHLSDEDRAERDEHCAHGAPDCPGKIEDGYEYSSRLLVYSIVIIQRRDSWIEEQLLRNDSYGSILIKYAKEVIKGPWLEAEPVIANNRLLRSDYLLYLFQMAGSDVKELTAHAQRLTSYERARRIR